MEIEEDAPKKKPKKLKRIVKFAQKEDKDKGMSIEEVINKKIKPKVLKKPKRLENLEKKINLFHQIKKTVADVNTKKMSRGQRKRLERKQKNPIYKKYNLLLFSNFKPVSKSAQKDFLLVSLKIKLIKYRKILHLKSINL
jgi:hypothetical protein